MLIPRSPEVMRRASSLSSVSISRSRAEAHREEGRAEVAEGVYICGLPNITPTKGFSWLRSSLRIARGRTMQGEVSFPKSRSIPRV